VTPWLRIALAAQAAFFAVWGGRLVTSHDDASTVWLATNPVDPRDLLSGHYVALRYRISSTSATGCDVGAGMVRPSVVYVRLEERGELLFTDAGAVAISDAVACEVERPIPTAGERWIAGRLGTQRGRDEIAYGIERFYVGETNALREATSGSVVAKVAIADDFQARIVALVPTRQPTVAP
jgi:uncharacterized membrane-anchored protein